MTLYNCRLKDDDCKTKFVFSAIKFEPELEVVLPRFLPIYKARLSLLTNVRFCGKRARSLARRAPKRRRKRGVETADVLHPLYKVVCLTQCGRET